MNHTERIWMTPRAHTRLKNEIAALRSQSTIEVPDNFMDYDDDLVATQLARRARIRGIQELLANAIVSENPDDIYTAEVEHESAVGGNDVTDVGGETDTFLLGSRGADGAASRQGLDRPATSLPTTDA